MTAFTAIQDTPPKRNSILAAFAVYFLVILTAFPELQLPGAENWPNLATLWGMLLFVLFSAGLLLIPREQRSISILPIISFLTFLIVVIFSFIHSINLEGGSAQLVKLLLLFLIYIIVFPGLFTSKRLINQALGVIVLIGVVTSLYGLYEREITGSSYITSHPWMELNTNGAGGISSYLTIVAPIVFCWMLYSSTKTRLILTLIFLLVIITLIGTAQRSSLLAFIVSIIPVLWLKYGRRFSVKRIIILSILFSLIGLSSYLLYSQVVVKTRQSIIVSSGQTTIESSNFERQILWQIGLDLFKEYPVLGGGFGTFRDYSKNYSILAYDYDAHGLSLKLLSETGLLGFILFNIFLLIVLFQTWEIVIRVPNQFYAIAVFSALCSSLVHNQFGTRYFFPLFWLVIGLAIAVRLVTIHESAGVYN